ncbi:MAG: TonB-dependent receptor [Acidobacteria bacterium]|nr:TonB-dependent receptor [Acidobacteriota bacterium]
MRSNRKVFVMCAWVALTFGCACSVYAQVASGTISGTVKDASGSILPGVTLTIRNVETGVSRTVITDDEGRYRAPELAVGNYDVQAELAGFQTAVRSGIQLTVGREAVVDFTLQVGEISEKVVVKGEAPMVNTTSATMSELVDQRQVHDLPLNGRDLSQLSLLTPGVTFARTAPSGTHVQGNANIKISVGGARVFMTGFLLDGTEINDTRSKGVGGAAGSLFGVETVREFQVLTNNYSAQYGRFAGGLITLVTKSGTNEFHGSVFEFHRNDNLDTRNFFDPANPPEFKRNQFGATLGGPIKKDRSFFFASYEGLRDRLGQTLIAIVPTAQVREGILPDGRRITISPTVKPFLDIYPLPTPGGRVFSQGGAEYIAGKTQPTRDDYLMAKIDHNFSDSYSLFGRYTLDDSGRVVPSAIPGGGYVIDGRNQYVTLESKKIFSPTLLNILRVGFNRSRSTQSQPPDSPPLSISLQPNYPLGQISPGSGISTMGNASPLGRNLQNVFQYSGDFLVTKGRQDLKIGVSAYRYQNNEYYDFQYGGVYSFGGLEAFLSGRPSTYTGVLPESFTRRGYRQWVFGTYVQDDIRLRSNFTMNLGLRYEVITSPYEVNGKITNLRDPLRDANTTVGTPLFTNPSKRNFAPRIGFAWDPFGDGKTSVRSGFGLFDDTILFYHYAWPVRNQPPFNVNINIQNPTFPLPQLGTNFQPLRSLQVFEYEAQQPYMMQWNLTVQREVLPQTTVTLAYVGSRGVNLEGRRDVNIAQPQILPDGRKFFAAGLSRRNPNFDNLNLYAFNASSFYHGMQLSVVKRLSGGLQFQGSYAWSRCLDDGSQVVGDFSGQGWNPQDPDDVKGSNRGLCNHHVGQNLSSNFVYNFPTLGRSGVAQKMLDGWQMNGIVTVASGAALQPSLGSLVDWNRDLDRTGDNPERPNVKSGRSNNPVLGGPDKYFDPTAFELPGQGFYGNMGRNTIIGPGVATFDFSLTKNTSIAEGKNVQFRTEVFNLFNRANFGSPALSIFSDAQGNFVNGVGRISSTSTTSRQIQLGLKFLF